jgi:hypothetical protein
MSSREAVTKAFLFLIAIGAAAIAGPAASASSDDRQILMSALAERFHPVVAEGIRATCPKDGTSWHDHGADDLAANGPFREDSIAFCDSYLTAKERLDSGDLSPWNAYEFYAYRRDFALDNRYVRLLVGPFLGRQECNAHRTEIIKSEIDVTLCKPVALN